MEKLRKLFVREGKRKYGYTEENRSRVWVGGAAAGQRDRDILFPGLIPITGFGLNAGEYSFPAYLDIRVSPCGPNSQHWLSALQD